MKILTNRTLALAAVILTVGLFSPMTYSSNLNKVEQDKQKKANRKAQMQETKVEQANRALTSLVSDKEMGVDVSDKKMEDAINKAKTETEAAQDELDGTSEKYFGFSHAQLAAAVAATLVAIDYAQSLIRGGSVYGEKMLLQQGARAAGSGIASGYRAYAPQRVQDFTDTVGATASDYYQRAGNKASELAAYVKNLNFWKSSASEAQAAADAAKAQANSVQKALEHYEGAY